METLDNNAVSVLWDMESKRRLWSVATIRFPAYVLVLYSDHAGGLVVAMLCRSYRWMFGTNSMIILLCVANNRMVHQFRRSDTTGSWEGVLNIPINNSIQIRYDEYTTSVKILIQYTFPGTNTTIRNILT
jgi:hypothetical protein